MAKGTWLLPINSFAAERRCRADTLVPQLKQRSPQSWGLWSLPQGKDLEAHPPKDEGSGETSPRITILLGLPELVGVRLTCSDQEVGSRLTRSLAKTEERKGREKRSVETWTTEDTEEDRLR